MTRRTLVAQAAGLPLLSWAQARKGPRVTAIETFLVKVNHRGNWLLVRVRTDAGVTGIGDASHGKDERTLPLIRTFAELLKGRSVYDIEWLRGRVETEVQRERLAAAAAFSGLEQAMQDIIGQVHGVPCHQLFGGALRRTIECYANINRMTVDRTPTGFAAAATQAVAGGFRAIKLAPFDGMPRKLSAGPELERHMQRGIDCAKAVRQVMGPDGKLLVDGHSYFELEPGLELSRRLEPLNLFWLEEVTDSNETLAEINRQSKMQTAGGEYLYGTRGFYPYIRAGAVDIVMPDVKFCGGMLEMKKIAAMAEGAGLGVSPHGPASPVGNVAAAHVCATLPNFVILEYAFGEAPWRAELIDPPEVMTAGAHQLTDRPGLGIRLNEQVIKKYAA